MTAAVCGTICLAQPAKSRTATAAAARKNANAGKTAGKTAATVDRATLQFPTAVPMPEDVVWRRDIYRQLDLLKDKNAPMYYPVEPMGRQVNLFTYLFRLVLTGRVPAYTYKLDGRESFEKEDRLEVKSLLENQSIYFEEQNGRLTVADSDVPSAEVTRFYIKESVYFDQRSGTFSTRVTALCPVLMRGAEEFSTEATPYPLFWINYEDVASWLSRLPMMGSNLNNVTNLTANDFFTMNRYEGKIYKTNNLQGRILANYCKDDSAMVKEQKRIEKQLADFEEGIWGQLKDSTQVDSLADTKVEKNTRSNRKNNAKTDENNSRRRSVKSGDSKPKSSAPRVSVRRQRR